MTDNEIYPLVETAWLADQLNTEKIRIIDARWRGDGSGRSLYEANHIPGAVHLDWQHDLTYTRGKVRYSLLPPDSFARVMGQAGVSDQTKVVAYADQDYSGAARIWWALNYYGHSQVAVLNGGMDKWIMEGLPLESGSARITPATFRPQIHLAWKADREEIQTALNDPELSIQLVDTRPQEQFSGLAVWTPPGSQWLNPGEEWINTGGQPTRAGRIPGAIHMLSSDNLDPDDWTYLPPETLRQRALRLGLRPEHRIITYCGSGISASLGLLVLKLAGFPDVALYDASWEEWGAQTESPIDKD